MKRINLVTLLSILFTIILLLYSCGKNGQSKDLDKKDVTAIPVEVSTAEIGDIAAGD